MIHIIGGGTFFHVRNHLSLAAYARGTTAKFLAERLKTLDKNPTLHLTAMAGGDCNLCTNQDVERLTTSLVKDSTTKIIFFNTAMCDFVGEIAGVPSGKYSERLHSREGTKEIKLVKAPKILPLIRKERKDIFLVAFKTTCGASEREQYISGLNLLKENSCNIVLANDTKTRTNMIIVPEEAKYCVTTDREEALNTLIDITLKRSSLTYTRSTVVPGESIKWESESIPESLRNVVDFCIREGAYKPFRGNTAGHFAVKQDSSTFLTSKRASNFNNLNKIGLVKIEATNKDEVIAYGSKPSVGGQSQRIIFNNHQDIDCIVHFHCKPKGEYFRVGGSIKEQFSYECGSHECGQNTSNGLVELEKGIKVVYLDEHGPNICFNKEIDSSRVIKFINTYFDLSSKTGGSVI